MDPITAGAASLAAVKAGSSAVTGAKNLSSELRQAVRKLRLWGKYDPKWVDLGMPSTRLTISQSSDLDDFLTSDRTQPILRFVALSMLTPTSDGHAEIQDAMKAAFVNEAKRWLIHSKEKWGDSIDLIWERLHLIYKSLIHPIDGDADLVEEAENYTRFLSLPLGTPVNTGGVASTYLDRLTALASDLDLLVRSGATSGHLAQLLRASGYGQIGNHLDVSNIAFQDLYVHRNFTDTQNAKVFDSEFLIASGNPFRVVLKGSPGAGKSTFVSHFVQAMATPKADHPGTPSVVIRCRDYAGSAWTSSVIEHAAQRLTAELSTTLSTELLEAMLLCGQLVYVFDGLDEITEKTQRAEMVQRIHAFTAQYPAASVLVTTRAVGYERAPLDPKIFGHLELQEFSDDQVVDYATKWFTHAGHRHLRESFMSESASVADLRVNPLLLSLLCNLYKSSGEIPTNRRDIYEECAQLLFKRWDAHRQIQVSHAMPKYANQLMREIARWFYSSQAAQSGVEEKQIAQAIARYMVDDIGFSDDEARESSKEFLNFCADRAWLLGSTGTNALNQRMYSFTHRTFFEFFASEAFAREANASTEGIASRIREAYERDSTSVLPELLIQSYHYARERGATHVFEQLCKASNPSTPILLLLRLLDGAVLAKYALVAGFNNIHARWTSSNFGIAAPEFTALLAVNAVARTLYTESFLMAADDRTARELFFPAWASLQLAGGRSHDQTWGLEIQKVLAVHSDELSKYEDDSLLNWLLTVGLEAAKPSSTWGYLRTLGAFGPGDGIISWLLKTNDVAEISVHQRFAIESVHKMFISGTPIPTQVLPLWAADKDFVPSGALSWSSESDEYTSKLRDILGVMILAEYEDRQDTRHLDASEHCWPGRISCVAAYRDWKHGVGPRPSAEDRQEARTVIDVLPHHLRHWTEGGRYLVADSRLE